jgi:hypothetical protein
MAPGDRDREDEVQDPPEPERIRGEAEEPPIDHTAVAPLTTEDDTEGG